ncbi:MAG: EamA family transporter, partial [Chloroflexota bacterium]
VLLGATIGLANPTAAGIAGYRRMGPTGASILMLFEPLVGVLLAALLIAEQPSSLQLLGGLLVLAGSALVNLDLKSLRGRSRASTA